MRWNEPMPPPPGGKPGWEALVIVAFILIMGFVCMGSIEGWFK